MGLATALATGASAQIKTSDQVGLVFPAFSADVPALGESAAFILKLSVQAELQQSDPVTQQTGYGRGISYFVPAPMAEQNSRAAAKLARLNGLQGTVWGQAVRLLDGVAIQSVLTLSPEYEDYREDRLEFWSLEVADTRLRLGPPQLNVSFLAETIPAALISEFRSPSTLEYCTAAGQCRHFEDYQISRVYAISDTGQATLRSGGIDYSVQLPRSNVLDSQVIDYAGMFIAYARGNFNYAESLSTRFIERHAHSPAALDAHLYRAAALARMGRFVDARQSIAAALEINPVAQRALRYGIMVEFAAEGGPTEKAKELISTLKRSFGFTDDFDKSAAGLI